MSEEQTAIVRNSQPLTQEEHFVSARGTADRQTPLGPVLSISGQPNST